MIANYILIDVACVYQICFFLTLNSNQVYNLVNFKAFFNLGLFWFWKDAAWSLNYLKHFSKFYPSTYEWDDLGFLTKLGEI